jgi:hypothetical protein
MPMSYLFRTRVRSRMYRLRAAFVSDENLDSWELPRPSTRVDGSTKTRIQHTDQVDQCEIPFSGSGHLFITRLQQELW